MGGKDQGHIFPWHHFGQVPAECSIGSCQVVDILADIYFTQDHGEFEIILLTQLRRLLRNGWNLARQRKGATYHREDAQRLAGGSRFVWIKKEEDLSGSSSKPLHGLFHVVISFLSISVHHPRRIHQHHLLQTLLRNQFDYHAM